jgi:hypothetical protein
MKMLKSLLFSIWILSGYAVAGDNQVQFSADTVTITPQQGTQLGKLYMGDNRMRTEVTVNDNSFVQIIDITNQTAYMINTAQKSYMRRQANIDAIPGTDTEQTSPCAGMQNTACRKLAEEEINGRATEKWEFSNTLDSSAGKMYYWLDKERKIPVRQTMPDGSGMQMTLLGNEKLDGRDTEKWEMKATGPGGKGQVILQWYDPELQMNIREEHPGGFLREIREIRIGPQPAALFTVPEDYREVRAGQGMAPGK